MKRLIMRGRLFVCFLMLIPLAFFTIELAQAAEGNDRTNIEFQGFTLKIPANCKLMDENTETGSVTYEQDDENMYTVIRLVSHTKRLSNISPNIFEKEKDVFILLSTIIKRNDGYKYSKFEEVASNDMFYKISYATFSDDYIWNEVGVFYKGNLIKATYITLTSNKSADNDFEYFVNSISPVR